MKPIRRELGELTQEQIEIIQRLYVQRVPWREIAVECGFPDDYGDPLSLKAYRSDWFSDVKQKRLSVANRITDSVADGRLYTADEMLIEHGFNPDEFRLQKATSNNWGARLDEEKMNYQHKIVAVPKEQAPTMEEIIKLIDNIEPKQIELKAELIENDYLLIPLYDMHFGMNDYTELTQKIVRVVRNGYKEILIVVGGDFLHTDNLNNTTVKGTQLEPVNFIEMVTSAVEFLETILTECLEHSPKVKIVYLQGNHASSNDYIVTWGVSRHFERLEYDVSLDNFKHAWLGGHSIFLHHGDRVKNEKRLLEIMVAKFSKEWGESASRYLITGHFHFERSLSFAGMTHYQMMSPSQTSQYEHDMGYIGTESGLMLFEFDNSKRTAIYFI